ncbi:MAG: flagellar motor protein MotB [Alphaproteobacteria bacterium]|nr:flagellar motor protein MotB [Alphaproteobacteria bacterium]
MNGPPLKRRKHEEPEDEGWLITFADMSVLLMSFFVLLFALSSPDMKQFKVVAEALRVKGFYNDAVPIEDPYEKVKKHLAMSLGASGFDKFIATSTTPQGINVELSSGAFFVPGGAKFTPEAVPMLTLLGQQVKPLAKADITIEVEGHTDDSVVNSAHYPSNWELSAARAANVVRFLVAEGFPPQKLKVIGLGGTMPKAPNRDAAGTPIPVNQDLNRRVVVKLIKGEDQ